MSSHNDNTNTNTKKTNTPIDFGPTPAEAAVITVEPQPVAPATTAATTTITKSLRNINIATNNTPNPTSQPRAIYRPASAANRRDNRGYSGGRRDDSGYGSGRRDDSGYSGGRRDDSYPTPPPLSEHVEVPVLAKPISDEEREALIDPIEKFEELMDIVTHGSDGVNENLLRGIYSHGFEHPSIIQARAIRPVLSGQDVIAQAQSGMGKTGAFCIGTLGRINSAINSTQAVVLAHTRELATQIETVFRKICINTPIRITICIGGIAPRDNVASLTGNGSGQRPHIVIGTPGRMIDMLTRIDTHSGIPIMDLRAIKMLVIDEADAMLGTTTDAARSTRGRNNYQHQTENQGFVEEINKIVALIPEAAQICLFSATMNSEFFTVVDQFLRNPIKVVIKQEELTLDGITQYCVDVGEQQYKFETMCDLYKLCNINQSIIYCNSKRGVDHLSSELQKNGFTVSSMHSSMDHQQREMTMADFHNGKSRVLVSTDLLARGIDVQQVSVVINYDLPDKVESYIHRIGRSGRYGRKGVAINFMTDHDENKIEQIQQYYHTQMEPLPANFERILD